MEDQYAGMGGSYAIDANGEKLLITRTDAPPGAPPDTPAPQPQATETPDQPANAGFFTPVTPATPADTTTHTE